MSITETFRLEYKNKQDKVITVEELSKLLEDNDYRVVLQDKLGPYFISTVWLGVPHFGNPYNYYETMVFLTPEGAKDPRETLGKSLDCYRYPTFEEAVFGHYQVIDEWKNKLPTKEDLDEDT